MDAVRLKNLLQIYVIYEYRAILPFTLIELVAQMSYRNTDVPHSLQMSSIHLFNCPPFTAEKRNYCLLATQQ